MGPDPKVLDDIARVAGGAVNILSGLQQQIRDEIKSRVEDVADRMDLVPREDYDRAMAMIAALEKRVAALESGHTKKAPAKAAKTTKTTQKKAPSKASGKTSKTKKSGAKKA